jgi:YesN/AraC family two-component response regulator
MIILNLIERIDMSSLEDLTVLYVEDDTETQSLIKRMLELSAREVFVASDGKEGLSMYKEKNPDIVMTDICMPNMDGLEMSEKIKEIDSEQLIAIFTAFNDAEYLKKASELDIGTYILKPFDRKQFFNSLDYLAMVIKSRNN